MFSPKLVNYYEAAKLMKNNYWKHHYFVMDVEFCFFLWSKCVCFVFRTRGKQAVTSFSFRAP